MSTPSSGPMEKSKLEVHSNSMHRLNAISHLQDKFLDDFMYLPRANRRNSAQVLRSGSLGPGTNFQDPPHQMLEIRDMLCYTEPLAIAVCKFSYSVVPEMSPCVERLQQFVRLLLQGHCDVGVEDDLLESCGSSVSKVNQVSHSPLGKMKLLWTGDIPQSMMCR
jgi:hypothetical protein